MCSAICVKKYARCDLLNYNQSIDEGNASFRNAILPIIHSWPDFAYRSALMASTHGRGF